MTYTPLLPVDRSVERAAFSTFFRGGVAFCRLRTGLKGEGEETHVRESFHSSFGEGEETHMLIPSHPRCRGPPGEALEAGGSEPSFHESLTY
jgi:hypothetical protein